MKFCKFFFQNMPSWRNEYFVLSNGVRLPSVGLGTFRIKGQTSVDVSVQTALKKGYRLIDTASVYRNEAFIATTLNNQKSFSRPDIFLTSKLGPKDHGCEKAKLAFKQSLQNLQTNYLDLYLIHWPGVQGLQVRKCSTSNIVSPI